MANLEKLTAPLDKLIQEGESIRQGSFSDFDIAWEQLHRWEKRTEHFLRKNVSDDESNKFHRVEGGMALGEPEENFENQCSAKLAVLTSLRKDIIENPDFWTEKLYPQNSSSGEAIQLKRLDDLQSKRNLFLIGLYKVTKGNRNTTCDEAEMRKVLGADFGEIRPTANYLRDEGYIRQGGDGWVMITHEGVKRTEDLLRKQNSNKKSSPNNETQVIDGSIFIAYSYREKDKELISGFISLLKDKGWQVRDGKADGLGSISQAILDKIRISEIVIIVMTKRDEKQNGKFTTSAWLLEEKGAALAFGKEVVILVEQGIDQGDIGGLQGDDQRFIFNRNNFMSVALDIVKFIKNKIN